MQQPRQFPKACRDCYAVHEAFRRLGFDAEELFVGFGNVSGTPDVLYVQLSSQNKTFVVPVEQLLGKPEQDVFADWQAFAYAVPGMTEAQLQQYWDEGPVMGHATELVAGLLRKGFVLPREGALTETGGA